MYIISIILCIGLFIYSYLGALNRDQPLARPPLGALLFKHILEWKTIAAAGPHFNLKRDNALTHLLSCQLAPAHCLRSILKPAHSNIVSSVLISAQQILPDTNEAFLGITVRRMRYKVLVSFRSCFHKTT
jgi:hypothetical protein